MKRFVPILLALFFIISMDIHSKELDNLFDLNHAPKFRNGPLNTRVASIWQGISLTFRAHSAQNLEKGEIFTGFQFLVSNFYAEQLYTVPSKYEISSDVETFLYIFEFEYGITDWFSAGIEFEIKHHHSGIMDPYIQSFHRTFKTPNGGREFAPNNRLLFEVKDSFSGKKLISFTDTVFSISDILLKTKFEIFYTENKEFGIGVILGLKLPTGSPSLMTGTGSVDFGAGLLVDIAPFDWWIFYINAYYIVTGDFKGPNGFVLPLANKLQFFISSEFLLSDRTSFIIAFNTFNSPWSQLTVITYYISDPNKVPQRISGQGYQMFIGFKYRISKKTTFQFFVMEDNDPWTTSDITFSFAMYFHL